jgi:DmsE family decaheme c-type cytochrome
MRILSKIMAFGALLGSLGLATPFALAADSPQAAGMPVDSRSQSDAVCTRCHDESETKAVLSIYQTAHGVKADGRTPTCQSCHGTSEAHVKNTAGTSTRPAPEVLFGARSGADSSFKRSSPEAQNTACLTCHEKSVARVHWAGSAHQTNDVACVSCHEIHTAHDKVRDKKTQPEVCYACHKEQRADSHKISTHPLDAGKIACSDCHNPHGTAGSKLLKKNTVNETCWSCHADKRGPFLFEHQPAVEDCTICHTPHGSNITPLLKNRAPFLCQDCHDGPHNSRSPYGIGVAGAQGGSTSVTDNAVGRACMSCHVKVHGSNSPAGGFLQR